MTYLIKKLKKRAMLLGIVVLNCLVITAYAQPDWSYDYRLYDYSCDIREAIVLLDGVAVTDGILTSFIDGECRGLDSVITYLEAPFDQYRFSFFVYSYASTGKTISFKYYSPTNDKIYDITEEIAFVSEDTHGDLFTPIEFNAISNEAPEVFHPIPNQSLNEHFGDFDIEVGSVFNDPDGDALSYTATTSSGAIVNVNVENSTLTLYEVGLGSATITLTADDGLTTTDDVFDVVVNNVNDAPEVVIPLADLSPNEGFISTEVSVANTFSDPDADDMSYNASSNDESVVSVSVNGTSLTVTEEGNGSATITVTATDPYSAVGTDEFNVTVNNVNDRPIVSSPIGEQNYDEHFHSTKIDLSPVFTDPDVDILTLTPSSSNPMVVTVGITNDTLTITEVGLGTSTVTITASDGTLSVNDVFEVNVNNVNDAPILDNPVSDQNLSEHFNLKVIDVSTVFSDPDAGDELTLHAGSNNETVITVTIIGNTLEITEVGNGQATVTLTARDLGGETTADSILVTVTNVNDAPIVSNYLDDLSLNEHFGTENIDLTNVFIDPDDDDLTLSPSNSNPSVISVEITGNTLILSEIGLGTSTVTINASDGSRNINESFLVEVVNVNDFPIVVSAISDQYFSEHFGNTSLNVSGNFTDPDGDQLTLSAVSDDTTVVKVSMTGGVINFTEKGIGTCQITVTANDGTLDVSDEFFVQVNNVNDAPMVSNPINDQLFSEHFGVTKLDISNTFTDPDDDQMLYFVSSNNTSVVSVEIRNDSIVFSEEGLGKASITLTANDGGKATDDIFLVTIENVNDAPEIVNAVSNKYYSEGFETSIISLATIFNDPDGDDMTYTVMNSDPSVVHIAVSGNILTITEFGLGTSTITLTATDDGEGNLSTNEVFSITVNNVNDKPTVVNEIIDQEFDEYFGTFDMDLSEVFNDKDAGDVLTLSISNSQPSVISLILRGNTLTVNEIGLGTSTVTVRATDNGEGNLWVENEFTITVNNVNDAPTVTSAPSNVVVNEYFSAHLLDLSGVFNDIDANDVLSLSAESSDEGVVTVSVSGDMLTLVEIGLGASQITVTATDNGTPPYSVNTNFNVTVNNINDPPTIAIPITDQYYNEHFGFRNIDLSGVFSDKDNDDLTITAESSNEEIVTISISGTILTIYETGLGAAIITLSASDGTLNEVHSFGLTVTNVNDAPVIDNAITDRTEDEHFKSQTVSLLGVFSDPDGDELGYTTSSSNTAVANVGISGTDLIITEKGLGRTTITVTASDGTFSKSTSFEFEVINVNDAPGIQNPIDNLTLDEHFNIYPINVASVFTDPDNDELSLSATSSNIAIVGASVEGTTLNLTEFGLGTATITLIANDGFLTNSTSFTVNVHNINDKPVIDSAITNHSLPEHFSSSTIDLTKIFSDPDGDILSYVPLSGNTSVITVGVTGTTLTITEVGVGSSTITVTASDGTYSVSNQFEIEVYNINDAPYEVAPIANQNLNEHFGSTTIDVSGVFEDQDQDEVIVSAESSNTAVVSVSVNSNVVSLTEEGIGTANITLKGTDGTFEGESSFAVTIHDINDAPVLEGSINDLTIEEHFDSHSINLEGLFIDQDGDALEYSGISSDSDVATIDVSGNNLILIEETKIGTAIITITATDGELSADLQFTLTVTNVNDVPVLNNPIHDVSYDEHFGIEYIDLLGVFSDPDGDILNLSAESSNEAVVTVNISGNNLVITEVGVGTSSVTISANDGEFYRSDEIYVEVININDAPKILSPLPSVSYNEGFGNATINLTPIFSDPDGDILSYSAVSSNTGTATVSLSGSILTIIEGSLGSSTITVTATDGTVATDDEFVISINNVNDRPEVISSIGDRDFYEGFSSQTINLSIFFSDPDGNPLEYSVSHTGSEIIHCSISGSLLSIIELGIGTSSVIVTATDGELSVDETFDVNILNINDAPVVDNPIATLILNEYFETEDISLIGVFRDPDGNPLSYTAVSTNTGAISANAIGTNLHLTEVGLGTTTIIVTAFDGEKTASTQFSVFVNNVNDAPIVVSPLTNRVISEGFTSTTFSLAPVFSDPDGQSLSLSAESENESVVGVEVNGTILSLTEVGLGTSKITVQAFDGELGVEDYFYITVSNVNDPPEVVGPVADMTLSEHFSIYTIDLNEVFDDPDENILSFDPASSDESVVEVEVDGSLLSIREMGLGSSIITVTASDGILSVSDAFNVTVYNINDAPEVRNSISNIVLDEHFGTEIVDISEVFSDPDGDDMFITASISDNEVASVNVSGTTLTITEKGLGMATVTITASDGALSSGYSFHVTINNVNDAPVLESPIANQDLLEYFNAIGLDISGVFSDPDGNTLNYSTENSNPGVVMVSISGTILTINESGLGSTIITLTASDGEISAKQEFVINVVNVNDPPVVVSGISDLELNEHFESIDIDLSTVFSDKDRDELEISAESSHENVVTVSIHQATLTITEVGLGNSVITLTASDGLASARDQFSLRVNNINDAPEVLNPLSDHSVGEQFGIMTIELEDIFDDPDGDDISISASSSNTGVATVVVSETDLIITEVAIGTTTIIVSVSDGYLSSSDQFVFTIEDVNFAPKVKTALEDLDLMEHFDKDSLDLLPVFMDTDGDTLSFSGISSNTKVLTVAVVRDTLVLTEVGIGTTTITVKADDGELYVEEQFEVTITNVNDAPVIIQAIENQILIQDFDSVTIDLHTVFSDPDADTLSFSAEVENTALIKMELDSGILILRGLEVGSTEVRLNATDGTYTTPDTLTVQVLAEVPLLAIYKTGLIYSNDTIIICNDAGEFYVTFHSGDGWNFTSSSGWITMEIENDSSLYIAYSENLSGGERIAEFTIFDEQGHEIVVYVMQTADCNPESIWDQHAVEIHIYPNPVKNKLTIHVPEVIQERLIIEVFDARGKLISAQQYDKSHDEQIVLDMSGLEYGLYLVKVGNGEDSIVKKVVK